MTTTKNLVTRARAEGLVILLVALGYVWQTLSIPDLYHMPGVPGPGAFPMQLGLVLGLAGLWRLVFGAPGEAAAEKADEPAAEEGAKSWLAAHGRFYGLWAVLLGFLALMPYAGFPAAAAVGLSLMFRLLGERRWWLCLALAVGATAVLHVAFAVGLGVRLPLGVLSFLGN